MRIGLSFLGSSLLLMSALACGDDSGTSSVDTKSETTPDADVEESDDTASETDETEATDVDATDESSEMTDAEAPPAESDEETDPMMTEEDPVDAGSDEPDLVLMSEEGEGSIAITFTDEGTQCGEAFCRNAEVDGFVGVEGCCFDEDEATCGFDMTVLGLALNLNDPGCERLDAPGNLDDSCPPSDPVPVLIPGAPPDGVVMDGCCQASGQCGFSADFGGFGFGCVDPGRFSQESTGDCEPDL